MSILIVESNPDLGILWKRHLERTGRAVCLVETQDAAVDVLQDGGIDLIVLDVMLGEGSALAVSDYASYRYPDIKVVFVTSTSFFSDGSIFELAGNACAYVRSDMPVEDLAAVIDYHAVGD